MGALSRVHGHSFCNTIICAAILRDSEGYSQVCFEVQSIHLLQLYKIIVFAGMDAATHLVAALEMMLHLTVSEGK